MVIEDMIPKATAEEAKRPGDSPEAGANPLTRIGSLFLSIWMRQSLAERYTTDVICERACGYLQL